MDRFENHVLLDFAFTQIQTNKHRKAILGKKLPFQDILLAPFGGVLRQQYPERILPLENRHFWILRSHKHKHKHTGIISWEK